MTTLRTWSEDGVEYTERPMTGFLSTMSPIQIQSALGYDGPISVGHYANDNLPRVLALTGAAGSGKSTAADYLVREHGYVRVKFAAPLKAMCRAIGMTDEQIEGSEKERPSQMLHGRTPRYVMQTLGTEWGRNMIGTNFWTGLWEASVHACLDEGGRVVCDDCRFQNEADSVARLGGTLIRLTGRGGIAGGHASEAGGFDVDREVANDGTLEDLYRRLVGVKVQFGMADYLEKFDSCPYVWPSRGIKF